MAPVACQLAIEWYRTREEAREGYRERLKALREAGWRRVSEAGLRPVAT